MSRVLLFTFAAFVAACASAPEVTKRPSDNAVLAELYRQDQPAREHNFESIDWAEVTKRDSERRAQVMKLLTQGRVRTAQDFYHAAMLFQHGSTPDDYRLAHSLAAISTTLNPSNEAALWLSAAAWDRYLMSRNLPQWYGTQFRQSSPGGRWERYNVDENAVSDAERARYHVPLLSVARKRAEEMNK